MKKHEKGQGLVEYALILVLVAIVVIAVLMLLGPKIGNATSTLEESLPPTENVQEPVVPLWVFGLGVLIIGSLLGIWAANSVWPLPPNNEQTDEDE